MRIIGKEKGDVYAIAIECSNPDGFDPEKHRVLLSAFEELHVFLTGEWAKGNIHQLMIDDGDFIYGAIISSEQQEYYKEKFADIIKGYKLAKDGH